MLYIIQQGRVHAALRPSEKSSQGQRACNKFNVRMCAPGPDAHTDSQRDAKFIRALTRFAPHGDRGFAPMRLRRGTRQARRVRFFTRFIGTIPVEV